MPKVILTGQMVGGAGGGLTEEQANELYLKLTGGTLTGPVNFGAQRLTNIGTPTQNTDGATKQYVDNLIANAGGFVASTTAPSNTKLLWIDTSNGGVLKYHNGTSWVSTKAVWG